MKRVHLLRYGMIGLMAIAVALAATTAYAEPPADDGVITLKVFVDLNGNGLIDSGEELLDGTFACMRGTGQTDFGCHTIEDGEYWFDSLSHGPYWPTVDLSQPILEGYILAGVRCVTYPDEPYRPCHDQGGGQAHIVLMAGEAVNVNFAFTPA